ncbi:UNVERIFIED_CONTAM: hypothetical protein K2H54_057578 [Gekko kuhli]
MPPALPFTVPQGKGWGTAPLQMEEVAPYKPGGQDCPTLDHREGSFTGHLTTYIEHNNYRGVDYLTYDTIHILGITSRPNAVVLNGKGIRSDDIHYEDNENITITQWYHFLYWI